MSAKYRIRLTNDRVIGPFSTEEIGELFLKGHITGAELCQQFPIGNWEPITKFHSINLLIEKIKNMNLQVNEPEASIPTKSGRREKTKYTTKSSTKTKSNRTEATRPNIPFNEFRFGKSVKIDINYAELEKKFQALNPHSPYEDGLEKTRVLRKSQPKVKRTSDNLEKTVLVRPNFELPKMKEEIKKYFKPSAELIDPDVKIPTKEELVNEKTEFINLAKALPTINAQLSMNEVEFEKQAKIEESQEKKRLKELQEIMLKEQALEDGYEDEELEVVEELDSTKKKLEQKIIIKKKRKGMSTVAILAFLGIFYFFLQEDEKPKQVGPLYLEIKFPLTVSDENEEAANKLLSQGRALYSQGTYRSRALASGVFLNSLQQRFTNNEAMGEIILTYSELLNNTKERSLSANTLYKYIQLAETKALSNHLVATGIANFYGQIGKYETAVYVVKNYLRAGNKPSPKMLAYYLNALTNAGDLVEARKVFETLKKSPKKSIEIYSELYKFSISDDKIEDAKKFIDEGLKFYPTSVPLLLHHADLAFKEESIKDYENDLKKIKKEEAENSPEYLASYLQKLGYLAAYKDKNKEAADYFKKSLGILESEDLRITLAKLEIGGDKISQKLILESKVLGLIKKAKDEYKNKNIDTAFQLAIEAIDADPEFIPAVLFHAELNMERGYFEAAINSLQKVLAENQQNFQVKSKLVQAFIKSFKFEEAERLLGEMALTKFAATPEYATLMGEFGEARKNYVIAIKWYDRALSRDPLRDVNMYNIARILVKNKRFSDAKTKIAKALMLDPKNPVYHALYSEILYDQDGTDIAIGYLRDTMSENGEDPVLISAITAFYFKSGQLKEFQAYYKKVQEMPKKDEAFYEVLIAAAKLEGRKDEYIKHSKDLLKLNSGNLKVRMNLGELYFEEKKYDDAIAEFNEIREKLISYPKVHFQLAKVYLARNEMDKAKEMALKELEMNPNLDSAHFIVGEVHRIAKEYREAIIKYEKAISLNPRSSDALISMASIRLSQNYANEALDLLSRAMREDISNPQVYRIMGDAYRAAGQRALAREKYEDYLKLSPGAQDKDLVESLIKNLK